MLILSEAEGKSDLMIHALKNNFEADAYFVKVMGKWLTGQIFSFLFFCVKEAIWTKEKRLFFSKSVFSTLHTSFFLLFAITAPPRPIKHKQVYSPI